MQLNRPFAKFPIRFCAQTLAAEVAALPQEAWVAHPDATPGNDAVMLVSTGGLIDQGRTGPMAPTPYLEAMPYVRQIMAQLGCVWSRSRLMGLAAGAQVVPHVDAHYHWRSHWRLHIPIITNPNVMFTCGDQTVHMTPGECWTFDSFRIHQVRNDGHDKRVHLVLDTVGGGQLMELLALAQAPDSANPEPRFVAPDPGADDQPRIERYNAPDIMSPWEIRHHVDYLLGQCQADPRLPDISARLDSFIDAWTAEWAEYGPDLGQAGRYLALVAATRDEVARLGAADLRLQNRAPLLHCLREIIFRIAVNRDKLQPATTARMAR